MWRKVSTKFQSETHTLHYQVFVKASADAKLNLTMSLTKQQDGKVQEIIDEVRTTQTHS